MAEITPKVKQEIIRDKYRGALLGLATGDALGTTVEFRSPGTFNPVTDMIGGGPFSLKPLQNVARPISSSARGGLEPRFRVLFSAIF